MVPRVPDAGRPVKVVVLAIGGLDAVAVAVAEMAEQAEVGRQRVIDVGLVIEGLCTRVAAEVAPAAVL